MKCHAEYLMGINTIRDLGKHEASYIGSAFRSAGLDREATSEEAIAHLRAPRQPTRTAHYQERYTDEQWTEFVAKWAGDKTRALDWLVAYQEKLTA